MGGWGQNADVPVISPGFSLPVETQDPGRGGAN